MSSTNLRVLHSPAAVARGLLVVPRSTTAVTTDQGPQAKMVSLPFRDVQTQVAKTMNFYVYLNIRRILQTKKALSTRNPKTPPWLDDADDRVS